MIKLIKSGKFTLSETKNGTKLLRLNNTTYAWIVAPRIGSLLIYSEHGHSIADVLSQGKFMLFKVVDEPNYSDHLHLEIEIGHGAWQGYILLTGFPNQIDTRKRIIPTHEIISTAFTPTPKTAEMINR